MGTRFRSVWCALVLMLPLAALVVPADRAMAATPPPPNPSISIGNAGVVEGASGYRAAVFNVVLSAPAAGKASVFFVTASGTAVAGTDYAARSGTITFSGNATSAVITVRVHGDTTVESDEAFAVNLSNPTGAVITNRIGTGTIKNDDGHAGAPIAEAGWTAPTLVFGNPVRLKVPVTLAAPQATAVTITLRATCLPALSCREAPPSTITLRPGQMERVLTFMVDPTVATEGRLRVRLTGGSVSIDTAIRASDWRSNATQPGLVLNELDYDNVGGDTAEFVEVFNGGTGPASLEGLAIAFVNGLDGTEYRRVELTGALAAGGYLVVADPGVHVASGATVVRFPVTHDVIQNGAPDAVTLIDTVGLKVLDALSYEGEITKAQLDGFPTAVNLVEGTAATALDANDDQGDLSRTPNGADTDDADTDWAFVPVATPGVTNHAPA